MSTTAKIIEHDTGKAVAVAPATQTALTPMDMLSRAVESGANIEVMEKLMALHERWEANQARKAFDEAIAQAKAEIPPIARNATAHNSKRYADFSAIARTIDPIISKYGLSYRFRSNQTDRISVTCVISHKHGHSEETTLSGPADTTGNKNAIQAIGSTLTYLQRYSLVQALGLAAATDDDGQTSVNGAACITDEQVDELQRMLAETKSNLTLFLKHIKLESLTQIRADKFDVVKNLILATARKREAMEAQKK